MLTNETMKIIDQFCAQHADLLEPDNAVGVCEWISELFCTQHPYARTVYCLGTTKVFEHWHSDYHEYTQPDAYLCHAVVFVDGMYVDFSYRQFDPTSAFPMVFSAEEFERDWPKRFNTIKELNKAI